MPVNPFESRRLHYVTLSIVHNHEQGTLLTGTSRGDRHALDVLRAQGWRWSRHLEAWYVRGSRDRSARRAAIESTATALRSTGYAVSVDIDDTARPPEQVEADRAARQQERVAALETKADRKAAVAEAKHDREAQLHAALPPLGEPIKIGHHSERRHRNALKKSWAALGAAVEADKTAEQARRRAESAATTTQARFAPVVVANRIKKLEAEQRADERRLAGNTRTLYRIAGVPVVETTEPAAGARREQIQERMRERGAAIEYWTSIRAEQVDAGVARDFGSHNIDKGNLVERKGLWYVVVRVNKKSVTVADRYLTAGTGLIPFQEISAVKPAAAE